MHRAVRDPVLFNLYELFCCCHHLVNIEVCESQLGMRRIHPATVLVEAVHEYALVNRFVSLGALKALDTVVKSSILRHQVERSVGNDLRLLPTTVMVVVVDFEHVVRGYAAKSVLVFRSWFGLQIFGFFKN